MSRGWEGWWSCLNYGMRTQSATAVDRIEMKSLCAFEGSNGAYNSCALVCTDPGIDLMCLPSTIGTGLGSPTTEILINGGRGLSQMGTDMLTTEMPCVDL